MTKLQSMVFGAGSLIFIFVCPLSAQEQGKRINFAHSKNPPAKTRADEKKSKIENLSIAENNFAITAKKSVKKGAPTEIYRVGKGDVLFISLQNAPAKESLYFTVLNDGMIDYPLAGGLVYVEEMTTDEIESVIADKITLIENARVSVRVRDYASHSITVLGKVEKAGEKFLQREAVPLFVIKAEAIVNPDAETVSIRRADGSLESFNLKDGKTDEVLIFPGDFVEFNGKAAESASRQERFYFIGGEVKTVGQVKFHDGLTLSQAIIAAGGLRKSAARTVYVRRKNAEGLLVTTIYDLQAIKQGRIPDPELKEGDTIEVGK